LVLLHALPGSASDCVCGWERHFEGAGVWLPREGKGQEGGVLHETSPD